MTKTVSEVVGTVLKEVRVSRKVKLKKAAEVVGVTVQQIHKYENGANRIPLENAIELFNLYGVSLAIVQEMVNEAVKNEREKLENTGSN